jgi:uridylate kinase
MRRVLLKVSGEALQGKDSIHDHDTLQHITGILKQVTGKGVQVSIVMGGGNIWRYRDMQTSDIERTKSDRLGMLATVFNAIALEQACAEQGVEAVTMSTIELPGLSEQFVTAHADSYLKQGVVVLCAGGTGNPFFTTDSAAALRACELQCDSLIKVTNVDGVYTADPAKDKSARLLKSITYEEALQNGYQVLDLTAFALCKEQKLPICVCNINDATIVIKAILGEPVGTIIHS